MSGKGDSSPPSEPGVQTRARAAESAAALAQASGGTPEISGGETDMSQIAPSMLELASSVKTLVAMHAGSGGSGGSDAPRAPRLPEPQKPDVFDGDSTKLRVFLSKARLYLSAYRRSGESDKARTLGSFLKGIAYRQFDRLWQDDPEGLTVEQVLRMLEKRFADQNEASDARYKLQHARQLTNQSVLAFSNYRDELAATPGLEDLRTQVNMFERFWTGMHPSLQSLLLTAKPGLKTKDQALELALDLERSLQRQHRRTVTGTKAGLNEIGVEVTDPWAASAPGAQASGIAPGSTHASQPSLSEMASAAALAAVRAWEQRRPQRPAAPTPGTQPVAGRDGKLLSNVQCWQCRQWGHYKSRCPKGRVQPGNG